MTLAELTAEGKQAVLNDGPAWNWTRVYCRSHVNCVQIQFAIDDMARADMIVESLLNRRLVACGQRTGPMISRYRWKGTLERSEEWLVLLKTRADLAERVVERSSRLIPTRRPKWSQCPSPTAPPDISNGSPSPPLVGVSHSSCPPTPP